MACYNDGNAIKCLAFGKLGINPGTRMVNTLKMLDEERIGTLDKAISEYEKKAKSE